MKILRISHLILAAMALTASLTAQNAGPSKPETGNVTGTVTDVNGDVLSGAAVSLDGPGIKAPQTVLSDDNGFFTFNELGPGTYHVTINAKEFADWKSPDIVLNPGQYLILTDCKLHIAEATPATRNLRSIRKNGDCWISCSALHVGRSPVFLHIAENGLLPLVRRPTCH